MPRNQSNLARTWLVSYGKTAKDQRWARYHRCHGQTLAPILTARSIGFSLLGFFALGGMSSAGPPSAGASADDEAGTLLVPELAPGLPELPADVGAPVLATTATPEEELDDPPTLPVVGVVVLAATTATPPEDELDGGGAAGGGSGGAAPLANEARTSAHEPSIWASNSASLGNASARHASKTCSHNAAWASCDLAAKPLTIHVLNIRTHISSDPETLKLRVFWQKASLWYGCLQTTW